MGVWYDGDIKDYRACDSTNPSEFGCSYSTWDHYHVSSNDIEEINKGIQKYRDLLKPYGINPDEMTKEVIWDLGIEKIQEKWNLSKDDAIKVGQFLYSYCFGCEILKCVQSKGFCEFFIPG